MLFKIDRDHFLEALSKTVPIAEKKSTLPILSHILLNASESRLIITATDLEVGLRMIYNCDVEESGSVTVPAKKMYEIMRELPSGLILLELTEGKRIKVSSSDSVFQLSGLDSSDYPAWITEEKIESVMMDSEKLLFMVEKTLFASSGDDGRYNLNGVLFEQFEDNVRMVATDGHRLALIDENLGFQLNSKHLVPRKGLIELRRLLENVKDQVELGFEPKNMLVKSEKFLMTIRLIEGDYPDYRKVIPAPGEKVIKADRLRLLQSLKRAAVFTTDRNRGINIQVSPGFLTITAGHPELGTAKDVLAVEYSGEEFNLLINVGYMMESLGAVDSEEVLIEYLKEGAPVVVRPNIEATYFNLVMPMRK